jgi:hypothetical protein
VPLAPGCPEARPASPEVTRAICRVPSTPFARSPGYARPVHLCRFRVRSMSGGCFPGASGRRPNPIRDDDASAPSPPAGPGMLTWSPSATPVGLALGAGSPCADRPGAGTLGLPVGAARTLLALLMSAFALPVPPAGLAARLRRPGGRSATARPKEGRARGFGAWLEPRYIFGAGQLARPVSCYAFFKGWLLLSQPPGCPGRPTSFPT